MKIKEFIIKIYRRLFKQKYQRDEDQTFIDPFMYTNDITLEYLTTTWPHLNEKQKNDILNSDEKMKNLPDDLKDRLKTINRSNIDEITNAERDSLNKAYEMIISDYSGFVSDHM